VFDVASEPAETGRIVRVEASYEVAEFLRVDACVPPTGAGTLAAALREGAACWCGTRRGADGEPEWVTLVGSVPETNVVYEIRLETDFAETTPNVRYAVRRAGEAEWTDLADAEGRAWQACADASLRRLSQVEFAGFGATGGFVGEYTVPALAEVAGEGYADLSAALAAAAARGVPATLLLDVAFEPDRATGAGEVLLGGHRLAWTDTRGWGLVFDPARKTFRTVARPAGGWPNGLSSYDSYRLGLDALDAASRPFVSLVREGEAFVLELNVRPPEGVEVRYRLETAAEPSFAESTLGAPVSTPRFTVVPDGARAEFFRVRIECSDE